MRRRLVLLRHAKSAWPDGVADHDRPLAGRGRREAPLAGRWLARHVPDIDLVVCSPATRARQTWRLVAGELPNTPEHRVEERVYAASVSELLAVVRELPVAAGTVLIVGHNPGLRDLVGQLSGTGCAMKTSSVAVLSGRGAWADTAPGWATLDEAETPRA